MKQSTTHAYDFCDTQHINERAYFCDHFSEKYILKYQWNSITKSGIRLIISIFGIKSEVKFLYQVSFKILGIIQELMHADFLIR